MRTLNIGRNATNSVILDDKMVSRQHAQLIILDNGQVVIKDLGSSNGTFVNGNKITECNLKAGDIVKCGNTFVKWTQYINESSSFAPVIPNYNNAQQLNNPDLSYSDGPGYIEQDFSLGVSLKYLTIKIFNIGDLFKTEWDKTQSILFYSLTPIIFSFIGFMIIYLKADDNFFFQKSFGYQVIIPITMTIFYYGIAQFLTISLLSLKGINTLINNLLASSILSFLMFITVFIPTLIFLPFAASNGMEMGKIGPTETLILLLIVLPILVCLLITTVVYVFNYFRAIGITKGISLHFTVLAFFINLFLQIVFTYFFMSVAYKNMFDILKML
ncbi:MAG: FHA domain-containing protein [Lentimicrobiaceae bacterium]|jgi:hypothetical protein